MKMPRKSGTRRCYKNKKFETIRTRLIEISIKVEDFIYHKKPISVREARLFINEVSSYKLECSNDERSLQVIERLTRCMKAIIIEHEEERQDSCHPKNEDYNVENGSASPVYSLPDEDRTQFTQGLEQVQTLLNLDYTKHESELEPNIQRPYLSSNNNTESINGYNDNKIQSFNEVIKSTKTVKKQKVTENVEIHKALSNLTLNDVDQDEVMSTDVECSQSILINFHEFDNVKPNKMSSIEAVHEKHICNTAAVTKTTEDKIINKPVIINNTIKYVKPVIEPTSRVVPADVNKNCNNIKEAMQNILKTNYNSGNTTKNILVTSAPSFACKGLYTTIPTHTLNEAKQKCTPEVHNNRTYDINRHITSSNNLEIYNTKTCKKDLDKNDKDHNNSAIQSSPAIVKKKRGPRKKKITESKVKENKTADNYQKKVYATENNMIKRQTKKTYARKKDNTKQNYLYIPIYNKNTENDLSWIESIRFVREIREDEYDQTNLNENFWDNYDLPSNFDEIDFLVG